MAPKWVYPHSNFAKIFGIRTMHARDCVVCLVCSAVLIELMKNRRTDTRRQHIPRYLRGSKNLKWVTGRDVTTPLSGTISLLTFVVMQRVARVCQRQLNYLLKGGWLTLSANFKKRVVTNNFWRQKTSHWARNWGGLTCLGSANVIGNITIR